MSLFGWLSSVISGAYKDRYERYSRLSAETITGTNSNDDIRVSGKTEDSTIDLMGGNNSLQLNNNVYSSIIASGNGHDTIRVSCSELDNSRFDLGNGSNTMVAYARDVTDTIITSGTGRDIITIQGGILSRSYIDNLDLSTGAGNDLVTIVGEVANSNISTGADSDTIYLTGTLSESTIMTDTGNDNVRIIGQVSDGSLVDTGAGNDNIYVRELTGSTIDAGAGNDDITVMRSNDGAIIDAGAGNDHIHLYDVESLTVHAGAGNDTVYVNSGINQFAFDGGSGIDRINFNGYFQSYDIYSANLKGFETIDIQQGSRAVADTLTIDARDLFTMDLEAQNIGLGNNAKALFIDRDAKDSVFLENGTATLLDDTYNGYDVYRVTADNNSSEMYILMNMGGFAS